MKGKRVLCLHIALLCIILVQLVGNWQCWLCTSGQSRLRIDHLLKKFMHLLS